MAEDVPDEQAQWRLAGDELTLEAGGTTITLLDRKVAEPDFPLDGVRWEVGTTITNADLRHHRIAPSRRGSPSTATA